MKGKDRKEYYFPTRKKWREWLSENHDRETGCYLIFYKLNAGKPTMRWEEAVQEALCYGWIDSTVKKLDEERRKQLFTPRKKGSGWSLVNKNYIKELQAQQLMRPSGQTKIDAAMEDGSWTMLDDVEALIAPSDLLDGFKGHQKAFDFFDGLSRTYKKSYLYWLVQAKKKETRQKRIAEIVRLCKEGKKSR